MKLLSRAVFFSLLLFSIKTSAAERIDINTAGLEDLIKIIHIGEIRALELISLRPFSSLDDLARIKGIGELRIEDIKEQGLAWVNMTELQPQAETENPAVKTVGAGFQQTYPEGIVLNEILASPAGADETNEWIEIFNQNNFSVDLSNWRIFDTVGSVKTYVFPLGTKIPAQNYLILERPVSKIVLNNEADGLKLSQPSGQAIDEVVYEKAPLGQSYNRTENNDWAWSSSLTPGSKNIVEAESTSVAPEKTPESDNNNLAAVSQALRPIPAGNLSKSFPIVLIAASIIALTSGAIILFLKKKIKYN